MTDTANNKAVLPDSSDENVCMAVVIGHGSNSAERDAVYARGQIELRIVKYITNSAELTPDEHVDLKDFRVSVRDAELFIPRSVTVDSDMLMAVVITDPRLTIDYNCQTINLDYERAVLSFVSEAGRIPGANAVVREHS